MSTIITIKKTLAECGPLSAFQITKETGLSFAAVNPALRNESFYSFRDGGTVLFSLAF